MTAMNDAFRTGGGRWPLLLAFLLSLSAAGCAGKAPNTLSASRMEAIKHNQRGLKAEAGGESQQALEAFAEALRINRSVENSEGIIVALVNSSRVHRHNGDAKAALSMISLAIPHGTSLSPLYSEVAFEMAQVQLLSGKLNEASEWAVKAAGAENGPKRGLMVNLQARILYLKGNLAEAEVKTREALLLNREHNLSGEEANSLRSLGDIQAADKRCVEASASYNAALAIDKTLGKSSKIAADLRALAVLNLSLEDFVQALGFYQRACAVSSASGDRSGAADDLLQMSRIHEKRGEKELADRMLTERDTLLKNIRTP